MAATTSSPSSPLPPELIETLRQTGIRLDREGRFWHQGAEVTHPGLRRALLCWIDRLDDGRPILRLDEHRYAYLEVEDAHLLATSARWEGDRAILVLNDGSEEELAYDTLEVARDDALYCAVRGGRLTARITTPAYYVLAERIQPNSQHDSQSDEQLENPPNSQHESQNHAFVLYARGGVFAICSRS